MLQDELRNFRLILASQSPRRRSLLSDAGFTYELAEDYPVEEVYPASIDSSNVAQYLSVIKSKAYNKTLTDREILITADTTVCVGGEVLGKPKDRDDAIRMLNILSGKKHSVVTGVTLRSINNMFSFSSRSSVKFRKLSSEEIIFYVDNYAPYDKAGAYGIQEWIGYIGIEGIEGSFFNVMGLPTQQLYVELKKFIQNM